MAGLKGFVDSDDLDAACLEAFQDSVPMGP